jgi:hypothetical protein
VTTNNFARQIDDNTRRIEDLERRMHKVEDIAASTMDTFGQFKTRSEAELRLMQGLMNNTVMPSIESLVRNAEISADRERAAALLRRARNNRTRIAKALKAS